MTNKKTITMRPYVSSCCKGGFKEFSMRALQGGNYYKCLLCGKSCEIEPFTRPNKKELNWEKELRERMLIKFIGLEFHKKDIDWVIDEILKARQKERDDIIKMVKGKMKKGKVECSCCHYSHNLALSDIIKEIKKNE